MCDHIRCINSLSEFEMYDLKNIANKIPNVIEFMLKNDINDIYTKTGSTKVCTSKLNHYAISKVYSIVY